MIWICWCRLQIGYYFGNLCFAERMLQKFLVVSATEQTFISLSTGLYFSGLIANGLWRQTGMRRYRKRAVKAIKKMNAIVRSRGLHVLHRALILEADFASTLAKLGQDEIKAGYDKAIAAASRAGFIQDAALTSELAAVYFIRANDVYWTKHYLTQTFENFREWEAKAKLRQLEAKYGPSLIDHNRAPRVQSSRNPTSVRRESIFAEDGPIIGSTAVDFDSRRPSSGMGPIVLGI